MKKIKKRLEIDNMSIDRTKKPHLFRLSLWFKLRKLGLSDREIGRVLENGINSFDEIDL
jgi:hypothetical protein